ncbi:hypothetical protein GCM10027290_65030 [Micromonospora sonneratiae]|uniref:Uncharacterized protein n=1 Tax=Micromonospora sonneratiae TaxID=1184706 RepID=A0ABW3YP60_9ACTN
MGADLADLAGRLDIREPLADARALWEWVESRRLPRKLLPAVTVLDRKDLVEVLTAFPAPSDSGQPVGRTVGEQVTDLTDRLVEAVGRVAAAALADEWEMLSYSSVRITTQLSDLLSTIALPDIEPRDCLEWRMEVRTQYQLTWSSLDRLDRLLPGTRTDARIRVRHIDQLTEAADAIRGHFDALLDLLDESRTDG